MTKKIILILLFLNGLFCQTSGEILFVDLFNNTIGNISNYLYENYPFLKEHNKTLEDCKKFLNTTQTDIKTKMFQFSGKNESDFGYFKGCSSSGNDTFYTLVVYIKNQKENQDFRNNSKTVQGICLPKECEGFINDFKSQLESGTLISKNSNTTNKRIYKIFFKKSENPENEGVIGWIIILVALIVVRGFFFLGNCCCFTKRKKVIYNSGTMDDSSSFSYIEASKRFHFFTKDSSMSSNKSLMQRSFSWKKIFEVLDPVNSLKMVLEMKNEFFDSSNLEVVSFFKTVFIIMGIYNHNFYTLTTIPTKTLGSTNFFESFKQFSLKFSTYSTHCWISLEGFVTGYKTFSFFKANLKQEKNKGYSLPFCSAVKFFFYFFPKFLIFFLAYFIIGYKKEKIFYNNPLLDYLDNEQNEKTCRKPSNFFKVFIPIFFPYNDFYFFKAETETNTKNEFTYCFKFVYIFVNMFNCFFFLLLLSFLSFKIKKKCFENCTLFILVFIFLVWFAFDMRIAFDESIFEKIGKVNNIHFFFGEIYSLKYTHLFFNIYSVGFFTGVIYFYYLDIISTDSLERTFRTPPFYFCYFLMKKLDKLSDICKNIFIFLIIIFIFSFCFFHYFVLSIEKLLTHELSVVERIFFLEDKLFFVVFLMILLILILFEKGSSSFKAMTRKSLFFLIDRLGTTIYCSMNIIIYHFYSVYEIWITFDFTNTLTTTIGITIVIIVINLVAYILVEQPVRCLVKAILRPPKLEKKTEIIGPLFKKEKGA